MPFFYELTIRESHLDSFGHMNNATYLQILEEARWEKITQGGYGLTQVHQYKQGPVILEINIQFLKEIKLREKIKVTVETVLEGKKVSKLKQQMIKENGEIAAEAIVSYGFFDLKERKLISPSELWIKAIGHPTQNS